MPATGDPLELIRATLAGRPAWLVGGAVRDRLLGRETQDFDVVLDGDPRTAARTIAGAAGRSAVGKATAFALSEEYGGWRVVARDGSWQIDVERLRGDSLEEDLALRDFTVNAIAEPLGEPGAVRARRSTRWGASRTSPTGACARPVPGRSPRTPCGCCASCGWPWSSSFEPDASTRALARAHAEGLGAVAGERVFMELARILDASRAVHGLELMGEVGATPVVLPEVDALRDVEQSRFHHLDVYDHTLEVLAQVIALAGGPRGAGGARARPGAGGAALRAAG